MKIVWVQYSPRQEYAGTNMENIRQVINELRKLNHLGIKYSTYLIPEGKTFIHFDDFENEEVHLWLQGLESFKIFANELWTGKLEKEPKLELPSIVASTGDFFG